MFDVDLSQIALPRERGCRVITVPVVLTETCSSLPPVQMEQAFARHLLEKIPEEEKAALFLVQHADHSPAALGL